MAFTNNFRIERIYFEKLKSNIDILKSYIEAGATGEALELLKNSVDVDGAVLLLYRNLGEAWAELADLIQKTQKDLKDLADKTEAYHDELNERIDEVNNYLMALIRELDARLQIVEQDLATMKRNKFYDLVENDGSYLIEKDGETVSFDDIKADADFPHNVILRYDNGTSVTELEIREFTDSRIDFYSIGLANSDKTVKEILVSIADTDAVTYSEHTLENPLYTFGTGLYLDSDNELSVDFSTVQAKLTEGTGIDIDSNNEISVDTSVIQAKLTEGFGIDIDSNNEIKVDTAQVQEKLIAGQNITLTPDTTDPTKTVISATDTTYSEGTGIDIDSNNVISADTTVLQKKLTAGSGIAIDPVTNEISNTAQGASYSADYGINIGNDNKISFKTPGLDSSSANFGSNTFASVTFSKGYQRNTYSGTLNSGNVTFGSQQYLTLNGLGFYVNANNQQVSTLPSGLILCILSCRVTIWAGTIGSTPKSQYLYSKNIEIPGVIEVSNGAVDFSLAYGENILIPAIYNVRKEFGDIHGQYNMTLRLIPFTTYTDTEILDIINSQKRYLNVALQYNYGTL